DERDEEEKKKRSDQQDRSDFFPALCRCEGLREVGPHPGPPPLAGEGSGLYFASHALKRWFSLSRFSSQNLSLIYSADLRLAGLVGRSALTDLSTSAVALALVTP